MDEIEDTVGPSPRPKPCPQQRSLPGAAREANESKFNRLISKWRPRLITNGIEWLTVRPKTLKQA